MRRVAAIAVAGFAATTLLAAPAAGATPGPPGAPQYWFDDWQVPTLWDDGARGQGVTIAEIDTGVNADLPELRAMAVFDVVTNNADRKGGHVLAGTDGRIYGVDHGLCLHVEPKLRTVLWGWVGQPLTPEVLDPLRRLRSALGGTLRDELGEHVTRREVRALRTRVEKLLTSPCFPEPAGYGPAIPWPAF